MKKLLLTLLVLTMCISMCACAGTSNEKNGEGNSDYISNSSAADIVSETSYDEKRAKEIVNELQNSPKLSLQEAYDLAFSIETQNNELLQLQQDLQDLSDCEGTFFHSSEYRDYNAEVTFYLQYGEYWFEIDYENYGGQINGQKVTRDGLNGFVFNASTTGVHSNFLTGGLMTVDFTIRFAQEKLYIEWGSSCEYYLQRA